MLRYLSIGMCALVAWIALVEILIRTFFPQPAMLHRLDPAFGYIGIPNKSGWYPSRYGEYKVKLRMNAEGFRDIDHEKEKPAGVYRILFLGDSFTEAKEVDWEQTYWRLLAQLLPTLPDGRRVEVINMGVSGFGTGQELLLLREKGLAYRPDLVVIAMTEFTDVWNNSRYLDSLSDGRDPESPIKPYFELDGDTLRVLPFTTSEMDNSVFRVFRRNFQTYMFIRNIAVANPALIRLAWKTGLVHTPPASKRIALAHPILFENFRADMDSDTKWVDAIALTRRLFVEVQRACHAAGAEFLVMSIPCSVQVYPAEREKEMKKYPELANVAMDWEKTAKLMLPFFREQEIDALHLHPVFTEESARNPAEYLYFPHDPHFSPHGHRVAAEQLKKRILQNPATDR